MQKCQKPLGDLGNHMNKTGSLQGIIARSVRTLLQECLDYSLRIGV